MPVDCQTAVFSSEASALAQVRSFRSRCAIVEPYREVGANGNWAEPRVQTSEQFALEGVVRQCELTFLSSAEAQFVVDNVAALETETSIYDRMRLTRDLATVSSANAILSLVYFLNQKSTTYMTTLDLLSVFAALPTEITRHVRGAIRASLNRLHDHEDDAIRCAVIAATRCLTPAMAISLLTDWQKHEKSEDVLETLSEELERIGGT